MIDKRWYQAYLLRLQRGQDQPHWRVTLQDARTGEVLKFATEWEFFNYLLTVLKPDDSPEEVGNSQSSRDAE